MGEVFNKLRKNEIIYLVNKDKGLVKERGGTYK